MALADAIAGAVRPSQSITWEDDDGVPFPLTGATITGKKKNLATGSVSDIEGLLTVTNGAGGVFLWTYATSDVAVSGEFLVQFTANFAAPPTPARTYISEWTVQDALT